MKHLHYLTAIALALTPLATLSASDKKDESSVEIEKTDVVESGTYKATATKVDPEEQEIYVTTDDGKVLELYLKKSTVLTTGAEAVAFEALKEGQKLEVKVEKDGKKLKPLEVKILE